MLTVALFIYKTDLKLSVQEEPVRYTQVLFWYADNNFNIKMCNIDHETQRLKSTNYTVWHPLTSIVNTANM